MNSLAHHPLLFLSFHLRARFLHHPNWVINVPEAGVDSAQALLKLIDIGCGIYGGGAVGSRCTRECYFLGLFSALSSPRDTLLLIAFAYNSHIFAMFYFYFQKTGTSGIETIHLTSLQLYKITSPKQRKYCLTLEEFTSSHIFSSLWYLAGKENLNGAKVVREFELRKLKIPASWNIFQVRVASTSMERTSKDEERLRDRRWRHFDVTLAPRNCTDEYY